MKQRGGQLANLGVDFDRFDFAAIGQSLGGNGVRVRNHTELESAISDALTADTYTVIACEIDRQSYDGTF